LYSSQLVEFSKKLKELDFVKDIIVNTPGQGTRLSEEHLF